MPCVGPDQTEEGLDVLGGYTIMMNFSMVFQYSRVSPTDFGMGG